MQFSSLDLAPDLQRALVECGYSTDDSGTGAGDSAGSSW